MNKSFSVVLAAVVLVLPAARPARAQGAPSAAMAGAAVWEDANCAGCHGENGQGGTDPDLPRGPNLRTTKLDRDTLTKVIACGRPGTPMPAWLKGAYTTTPCYAAAPGPAPAGTTIVGAYDSGQIKALVDYLETNFIGK